MSSIKNIFTIGYRPLLSMKSFVGNMQRWEVNCLVDIRRQPNLSSEFCVENLKRQLKTNGIWYLSFIDEFGVVDSDAQKKGQAVYEKVILTERFLRGVDRLNKGAEKGYIIAILGENASPVKCYRNLILGRYLDDNGWNVYHILGDGSTLTQKSLTANISKLRIEAEERSGMSAQLGRDGEEIAADYLIHQGYTILDNNWNLHKGCELDIVAFKDNVLHAIEVKTRSKDDIAPEMAIDEEKMKHLIKALQEYRYHKFLLKLPCQIDSIAIVMKSDDDYTINMYEKLKYFARKEY